MTIIIAVALAMGLAAQAPANDVKLGVEAWKRGDYPTAIETWRPLAIGGDADAQFNLAQAYKLGRGVPVDPVLAESWFRKAAMQGHPQAEDSYGLALFQSGKRGEALPWLEKSVARGEPRTQLVLGTMLFNGDSVTRDMPRAYALMTRAAAARLPSAQATLAEMDSYISPVDRQHGILLAQQYAAQTTLPGETRNKQVVRIDEDADRSTRSKKITSPMTALQPPATSPGNKVRTTMSSPSPQKSVAKLAGTPTGHWRIQLGAFTTDANARTQWSRLRDRLKGAEPHYFTAGSVTRLQAGFYDNRAQATQACRISRVDCFVLKP